MEEKTVTKKHAVGRPPKYKTPAEMQLVVDKYFADRDVIGRPYTVTGLALALGMDRDSILNYEKKSEFFGVIKKAREKIIDSVEEFLISGPKNVAGLIFWLKNNAGWVDKRETEHSGCLNIKQLIFTTYEADNGTTENTAK